MIYLSLNIKCKVPKESHPQYPPVLLFILFFFYLFIFSAIPYPKNHSKFSGNIESVFSQYVETSVRAYGYKSTPNRRSHIVSSLVALNLYSDILNFLLLVVNVDFTILGSYIPEHVNILTWYKLTI